MPENESNISISTQNQPRHCPLPKLVGEEHTSGRWLQRTTVGDEHITVMTDRGGGGQRSQPGGLAADDGQWSGVG
jgi:hypothetical protein